MKEIIDLSDKGHFEAAAKISDKLDWERFGNLKDLNTVATIYRNTKDYEKEFEVLKISYKNTTSGRVILENMIKCAIKLKNFNDAVECFNELTANFPNNANVLYLKYLLYKEQGAAEQDQINILEEYCRFSHDEKALFELAYLYHSAGMINKCVSKCDDIILLFHPSEESFRAMELKMRYVPLNDMQKEKYQQKHKNIERPRASKEDEPIGNISVVPDNIFIPDYSQNLNDDIMQEDLSKNIQSVMSSIKSSASTIDSDDDNAEDEIPGQLSIEEALSEIKDIEKKNATKDLSLKQSTKESPYLSGDALLRARTKELAIQKVVTNEALQQTENKPPVALSETQTYNIKQNISNDLADILKGNKSKNKDNETHEYFNQSLPKESDDISNKNNDEINDQINNEINEEISNELAKEVREFVEQDFDSTQDTQESTVYVDDKWAEKNNDSIEENIKNNLNDYTTSYETSHPSIYTENNKLSDNYSSNYEETEYRLTDTHRKILGYFADIAGFDRTLAKSIHYLQNGRKYMAVSSLSVDNRVNLSKQLLDAALRDTNSRIKLAVVLGKVLNDKDIDEVFNKVQGGYLIIDEAGDLLAPKVSDICRRLRIDIDTGIVICDTEKKLKTLFEFNPILKDIINVRIHLPVLTNKELASFGDEYAMKCGYKIDAKARLAIYDIIGQLQQGEMIVTVNDIKALIDNAIQKKENKKFGLFNHNKATDNILIEKDFL